MTKLEFAIHLFATARRLSNRTAQRVPVVSLLALLELSRTPDEWKAGSVLADRLGDGFTANTLGSSTRGAIEAGYLERRAMEGGVNGALEYRITKAGQHVVAQLLKTEEPKPAAATA